MSASAPRKAAARLYRDYLQPDRLAAFAGFLTQALDAGYQTMTLTTFAAAVARGDGTLPPRVLLVRHDVDSDVPRARRMREIERGLGTVGTYFFRRMTWDVALMRELEGDGCDVGYHYEELATLVKELGATEPAQAASPSTSSPRTATSPIAPSRSPTSNCSTMRPSAPRSARASRPMTSRSTSTPAPRITRGRGTGSPRTRPRRSRAAPPWSRC